MTKYYRDYLWKNGFPYGIHPCDPGQGIAYKLVADPYNKRVTIEQYADEAFVKVVYDSALFDFRHLKLGEQLAWQKTQVSDKNQTIICHIRNQDDRLLLIEEYVFEQDLCRECRAFSPLGCFLLSIQKIYYLELKDTCNGVVLFDSNEHPVMSKDYAFDEEGRVFSTLVKENWEISSAVSQK